MRQPVLKVPTTLIHGDLDIRVPVAFARDYVAKAASSQIKLIELEGIGHFEVIDPRHKAVELILEQLNKLG
jgi:pimeloyl-ACP methyl ester carboxylesterase